LGFSNAGSAFYTLTLNYHQIGFPQSYTACFVLHNIAVSLREPEVDYDNMDDADFDVQEQYQGPQNGNAVRKDIADSFF